MIEGVRKATGTVGLVLKIVCDALAFFLLGFLLYAALDGRGIEDSHMAVTARIGEIYPTPDGYSIVTSYSYQNEYYLHVRFHVDKLPDGMKEGEDYTLYIDPEDPRKPKVKNDFWDWFPKFIVLWLIAAAVLIYPIFYRYSQSKKELPYGLKNGNPKLKEKGEPVKARVIDYGKSTEETDGVVRVQYYVIVDYIDSKRVLHKAGTGYIGFNPTQYIKDKNKEIIVYINPKRPSKCYIDVEEMYEYLQFNRTYTYDTSY